MSSDEKWRSLLDKGKTVFINTENPGSYSNYKSASEFLLQNFDIFRQIRNNLDEKPINNLTPNIGNRINTRFVSKDNISNSIRLQNETVDVSKKNVINKAVSADKPLGEFGEMTLKQGYLQ